MSLLNSLFCGGLITSYVIQTVSATSVQARSGNNDVRLNQVQVIGTHNSYHIETTYAERPVIETYIGASNAQDLYYSHPSITDQFTYQSVRGLELDLYADSAGGAFTKPLIRRLSELPYPDALELREPGTKVLHVSDLDVGTTCYTFLLCLKEIKKWSKANKGHTLITIVLEFKIPDDLLVALGGAKGEAWSTTNLNRVDAEIRSVFKDSELLTPDDIRKKGLTLEQSVLTDGWPTQKQARDKVMFVMDNDPISGSVRDAYRLDGHENLEERVIFTNSIPGQPDAAFLKRNDPLGENTKKIQDLVNKGYFVRTRSDLPIDTVLKNDFSMLKAALESGAQLISTDFQAVGMASRYNSSYVARLPEGGTVRCNPVNAGRRCQSKNLERLR